MPDTDPRSPAWRDGYRDGYLFRPASRLGDPAYMDGRMTGEAETGAPREYIDPALRAECRGAAAAGGPDTAVSGGGHP